MEFGGEVKPRQASIEAKIVKADGTVIELGTVDYYHRSFFVRLWWRISRLFNKRKTFWR